MLRMEAALHRPLPRAAVPRALGGVGAPVRPLLRPAPVHLELRGHGLRLLRQHRVAGLVLRGQGQVHVSSWACRAKSRPFNQLRSSRPTSIATAATGGAVATVATSGSDLAAGCGGGDGSSGAEPPPNPPPPSPPPFGANFSEIQAEVFTPTCAVSGCHTGAAAPQGLRLDEANSYGLLVDVASMEVPSLLRVEPALGAVRLALAASQRAKPHCTVRKGYPLRALVSSQRCDAAAAILWFHPAAGWLLRRAPCFTRGRGSFPSCGSCFRISGPKGGGTCIGG